MKLSKKRRDAVRVAIVDAALKANIEMIKLLDVKSSFMAETIIYRIIDDAWKNVKTALDLKDET